MTSRPESNGWRSAPVALVLSLVIAGCQPTAREEASAPEWRVDSTALGVEPGTRFTWVPNDRAELYRIELYNDAGELLSGAVTGDTAIPADVVLPDTARTGTWRVVPVTAGGTELPASPRRAFQRR